MRRFSKTGLWNDIDFTLAFGLAVILVLNLISYYAGLLPLDEELELTFRYFLVPYTYIALTMDIVVWIPFAISTLEKRKAGHLSMGLLVWFFLTILLFLFYLFATGANDKIVPPSVKAESNQKIVSEHAKPLIAPRVELHRMMKSGFEGLCKTLPEIGIIGGDESQKMFNTMDCKSSRTEWAASFGDGVTDWRWCLDSNGFNGVGKVNKDKIACE